MKFSYLRALKRMSKVLARTLNSILIGILIWSLSFTPLRGQVSSEIRTEAGRAFHSFQLGTEWGVNVAIPSNQYSYGLSQELIPDPYGYYPLTRLPMPDFESTATPYLYDLTANDRSMLSLDPGELSTWRIIGRMHLSRGYM